MKSSSKSLSWIVALGVAVVLVTGVVHYGFNPDKNKNLEPTQTEEQNNSESNDAYYKNININAKVESDIIVQNEPIVVDVSIQNMNEQKLDPDTKLSYHLYYKNGETYNYDGPRYEFDTEILNEGIKEVSITIPGIKETGDFDLVVDLVIDGVAWYSDYGMETFTVPLFIEKLTARDISDDFINSDNSVSTVKDDDETINMAWRLIENAIIVNEGQIKLQDASYKGFTAGGSYPQFWVRDNNTIMYGSRFFSDKDYLHDWIELHLKEQNDDGNINDWVNFEGEVDKNTVETDQETSLIQAAYKYVSWSRDINWLNQEIKGKSVIMRLTDALNYLLNNKTDEQTGLLMGAHTIDWGDVELGEETQEAIYLDDNSVLTVDIYENSMFVISARNLAELYSMLGDAGNAKYWDDVADDYIKKARTELWMPDKGYFKICKHITECTHDFDEDEIFGMGGNAMAILSGIADEDMTNSIFAVVLERQNEYGVSTISGTVLPAYPANTFVHPAISNEYSYQNGGQWDWFGARLISAMFLYDGDLANEKLLEITSKISNNHCINEWEELDGTPKGSENYAGAAGVIANAIVTGRYGINWEKDLIEINPSVGFNGGSIALTDSATGNKLRYTYSVTSDEILLDYETDQTGKVIIKIPVSEGKTITVNFPQD